MADILNFKYDISDIQLCFDKKTLLIAGHRNMCGQPQELWPKLAWV